jgi:hypothetical protein
MSDFSFTATAQCEKCGSYLSSSNEKCDHDGLTVEKHVFRHISNGRDSITGVHSTAQHKWYALEEKLGEDWIEYEYIGPKQSVNRMLNSSTWDSVEDLPRQSMSLDAPRDVAEAE